MNEREFVFQQKKINNGIFCDKYLEVTFSSSWHIFVCARSIIEKLCIRRVKIVRANIDTILSNREKEEDATGRDQFYFQTIIGFMIEYILGYTFSAQLALRAVVIKWNDKKNVGGHCCGFYCTKKVVRLPRWIIGAKKESGRYLDCREIMDVFTRAQ